LREKLPRKKRTPRIGRNITAITGILLIGEKIFGVFWSFGENSMRIYRDGRQISNPKEVHKRGGLKIK
jgi:hypothetical protein